MKEKLLGQSETNTENDFYQGRFTGKGWVTADHDEGSFISSISTEEFWERVRARGEKASSIKKQALEMGNLFPAEWEGTCVEYEITVIAKRITPDQK